MLLKQLGTMTMLMANALSDADKALQAIESNTRPTDITLVE